MKTIPPAVRCVFDPDGPELRELTEEMFRFYLRQARGEEMPLPEADREEDNRLDHQHT